MPTAFEQSPVINSPFRKPERHFHLNEDGSPTGVIKQGRRPSAYFVPIPPARKKGRQVELALEEDQGGERVTQNDFINEVRGYVDRWRELPASQCGVSHETARLLLHWRAGEPQPPLFFCQIEAVETLIWLTEVAGKQRPEIGRRIERFNAEANPELFRIALKMATGSGKTTVMAMLIAWQTVNFARRKNARLFSDAFLIVTPGITIKDRLRVLLPSDPQNYYEARNLIPRDMLDDVRKARVVITNYHAFRLREKLQAPKLTKQILRGRDQALITTETEGEMIRRVCPGLMGRKNIVVINDEAHHCYRRKVAQEQERITPEERDEAKKNEEAARVWISGLEAIKRSLGLRAVYDLSATPFFLRGSGYPEATLFPWVVSDFSLMDAIESGIVKIPRVPVSDDQVGKLLPVYRDLYRHIREDLPKKGRAKQKRESLDPDDLPKELTGGLNALYGHYIQVFDQWQANEVGREPVFIVVCNNTSTSKLVYDHIAGYEREESGQTVLVDGKLPLFRNVENGRWLHHPRTLLIDSEQLDSGEALTPEFKKIASREIDEFKAELRTRFPDRDVEKIDDEDLLREVMNTVGKPGRLGEHVRCVVSVSMLTEGWDANTVTHILGVRAFGTQLLCEQVVGRGLRRVNYDADGNGMFEPEYADVLGVPFTFVASHKIAAPRPPKPITRVYALPEREALEIRFPRVVGYRVRLPSERLSATFTEDSRLVISPDDVPTRAENEGIVGEGVTLTLEEIGKRRLREVEFYVAGHALRSRFRDDEGNLKPYLFPQLLRITREWLGSNYLECKGDTRPQYLLWRYFADLAVERIYRAVTGGIEGEERLRPIIDSYNPWGSSRHVDFTTSKNTLWTTGADRCEVNYVVHDSDWEANFCEQVERMPEVVAYVKNHGLGFEVPYLHQGAERRYWPDFILEVSKGADEPLHLIVEIKGYRQGDAQAKADTMRSLWVPAVNNHGKLGRWAFLEIRDIHEAAKQIRAWLDGNRRGMAA
jgi:type III restriction enzyme